ncbi:MAG: hypothetical protein IPH08_11070 [Rhodocyclaceae bacterium]|nr:hypothetical protein [Rhodocyclaceae bacterium]
MLRIDGSLDKFGEEGLARLRFARARRYITVDIQIPETAWQPRSPHQRKEYIAQQVKSAILSCVQRLQKDGLSVQKDVLSFEVNAATSEFLAHAIDG